MRDGLKQMPSTSQKGKWRTSKKKCTIGITWDVGSKRRLGCLRLQLNACLECSFPGNRQRTLGAVGKNPPASARDTEDVGSFPGLGRSPGGGSGSPLQYSCLGNPTDGGAWQTPVKQSMGSQRDMTERLNYHHHLIGADPRG